MFEVIVAFSIGVLSISCVVLGMLLDYSREVIEVNKNNYDKLLAAHNELIEKEKQAIKDLHYVNETNIDHEDHTESLINKILTLEQKLENKEKREKFIEETLNILMCRLTEFEYQLTGNAVKTNQYRDEIKGLHSKIQTALKG